MAVRLVLQISDDSIYRKYQYIVFDIDTGIPYQNVYES